MMERATGLESEPGKVTEMATATGLESVPGKVTEMATALGTEPEKAPALGTEPEKAPEMATVEDSDHRRGVSARPREREKIPDLRLLALRPPGLRLQKPSETKHSVMMERWVRMVQVPQRAAETRDVILVGMDRAKATQRRIGAK
jgi:hypothetical protein